MTEIKYKDLLLRLYTSFEEYQKGENCVIKVKYKDLLLRLYTSFEEYQKGENCVINFSDAQGNPVDVDISNVDLSGAQSREHFASDDTYVPACFHWEACTEEPRGIICTILKPDSAITYRELLTTIGHELGHLTSGSRFKDAEAPYDTPEGYEQEEKRAQAFEEFTEDVYKIAGIYERMLLLSGRNCSVILKGN